MTEGQVRHSNGHIIAAQEAEARARRPRWLRACQLTPLSDCTIEVAERSLAPVVRADIETGDHVEMLPLDPAVMSHDVSVAAATLADMRSDADRVARALPAVHLDRSRRRPAIAGDVARQQMVAARAHARGRGDRCRRARQPHARAGGRSRHHQYRRLPGRSGERAAPGQPRHREPAGVLGRRRHQPHELRHRRTRCRARTARGRRHRAQYAGARSLPRRRCRAGRDCRCRHLRQHGDASSLARPAGAAIGAGAVRRHAARGARPQGARSRLERCAGRLCASCRQYRRLRRRRSRRGTDRHRATLDRGHHQPGAWTSAPIPRFR